MRTIVLFLFCINILIIAQPSIVDKKIIELNQPLAGINKIKKINETEFGAVGEIINNSGDRDIFFAKFNLDSLVFSNSYPSDISLVAQDFEVTKDSSFIIIGNNILFKIDNSGNNLWIKEFEEAPYESTLYSIVKIDDDNFIACGYLREYEYPYLIYNSIWLIKFNGQGEIIWDKEYHRESNYESDYGLIVKHTIEDNFIISGTIGGSIFVLKTDSEGNEIFFKYYTNYGLLQGLLKSRYISEGLDNSYYLIGSIPVWNHGKDILLIKTDYLGDTLFVKNYNGNPFEWDPNTSSGDEYGIYMKILDSNNVILGGNGTHSLTNNPIKIILQIDSFGNVIWKHIIESQNYSRLLSIETSNENRLLYLGVEDVLPNKIFIITTSYNVTDISAIKPSQVDYILYQNYPNPFNPITKISYSIPKSGFVELKIYDSLGREISTLVHKFQNKGNYRVEFNGTNASSGVYFYRLLFNGNILTKKFLLIR